MTGKPSLYVPTYNLFPGRFLRCGLVTITLTVFCLWRPLFAYGSPVITSDLGNQVAISGNAVTLQVSIADTLPVTYQWYYNSSILTDATNAILSFVTVQPSDAGRYSVAVTDSGGSVASRTATLTVENYPNPMAYADGNNTIAVWGDNSYGQTNLPIGETNIVALAGGELQTVFLRRDGTLGDFSWAIASPGTYSLLPRVATIQTIDSFGLCLQTNGTPVTYGVTGLSGASDVPASVTNAVATVIGVPRLAIKDDGTVMGWLPAGTPPPPFTPPALVQFMNSLANLSNVIGIATSGLPPDNPSHCLVLYSNHTVAAFGTSQAGDSTVVPALRNVKAISGGGNFSVALMQDGTVTAWGDNTSGQTNVPPGLSGVMAISTGDLHTLALESNGMVVAWGDNTYGQCNVPGSISNVVYIAAGGRHSAVLTKQPGISKSATSLTVAAGGEATFNIVPTGYGLLNYQWEMNGTNIAGATNSLLTLTNVPLTGTGVYQCVVSNSYGICVSPPATLAVYRTIPRFDSSSSGLVFSNGGFVVTLDQLSGHGPVIIYASTNLQNWIPIYTNPPVLGSLQYLDFGAGNLSYRFYRAMEQ